MCIIFANQHDKSRTIQVSRWLYIRTTKRSMCIGICTDGAAAMTGRLSGLTAQIKKVAPECKSTHSVIYRKMLASRKITPEFNSVLIDVVIVITHIKTHVTRNGSQNWLTCDTYIRLLNEFNLSLQRKMTTAFELADKVAAYTAKLELW